MDCIFSGAIGSLHPLRSSSPLLSSSSSFSALRGPFFLLRVAQARGLGAGWKRPRLCMGLSVAPVSHYFLITDIVKC